MNFLIDGQDDIFRELIETIRRKNSLAFIGSGVSKDADYPLWFEFVDELAKYAKEDLQNLNQLNGYQLIEAVDKLKKKMGDIEYYSAVRKIFEPRLRKPFSMMHQQILEMPFLSFPTTNIDDCHMAALKKIPNRGLATDYDVQPLIRTHKLAERRVIYIHGKIDDGDSIQSIVLSKSEYESAYDQKTGAAREFMIYALRRLDCIFIGYSMNDIFMLKIMEEAKEVFSSEKRKLISQGRRNEFLPKHYAIIPRYLSADGKVFVPSTNKPLTQEQITQIRLRENTIEQNLINLNITPLYYTAIENIHTPLSHLVSYMHQQLVIDESQVPSSKGTR